MSAVATSAPLLMEPHRLWAGSHRRALTGLPNDDQLATALTTMEVGPTRWVVDDLWVPSLLLRDVTELPEAAEAREAFWRWRFQQGLGLPEPASVQALRLEQSLWLLAGLREDLKTRWTALATQLGRPIQSLVPRWLALYNHLAPEQHAPGLLLSLAPHAEGGFTGTLVAWGHQLCLLRQWPDPLSAEGWQEERVLPSLAFLQREGRQPQSLHIFGAPRWPDAGIPTTFLVEADLEGEED